MKKVFNSYKNYLIISLFFGLLFLMLLPLILKVTYPINDDWVYYYNVRNILNGDFSLHAITTPSFYTQGTIGAAFGFIFGVEKLPILTLLLTIVNAFLIFKLLYDALRVDIKLSFVASLMLFLVPLNIYSSVGFMTEEYFMFFTLISFYFYFKVRENYKTRDLILFNISAVLGFFVRQIGFVSIVALTVYFFVNKKWKYVLLEVLILAVLLGYYLLLFPRTTMWNGKGINFEEVLNVKYSFTRVFAVIIYLCAYLIPLIFTFVLSNLVKNKKHLAVFIAISLLVSLAFLKFFNISYLDRQEFPYFENTVENYGFYSSGVDGTKYIFKGSYDLYRFWNVISIVGAILLMSSIVLKIKNFRNYFLFYFLIYLVFILTSTKIYDRYMLPLFPVLLFYIFENSDIKTRIFKFKNAIISVFLVFILAIAFYNYNFLMDFVGVNSYIWNKSEYISSSNNIDKKYIMGTNSWKLSNRNIARDYKYMFSYDSMSVKPELKGNWEQIEEANIEYPLNIFVNPKIYLYKNIN